MGSLPNLHELEQAERKRERRREREQLREQRARDTSRERERIAMMAHRKQSSYNAYLLAGGAAAAAAATANTMTTATSGAIGPAFITSASSASSSAATTATTATTTTTTAGTATTTLSGLTMGGAALFGIGNSSIGTGVSGIVNNKYFTSQYQHQHYSQHQHQHRHSLTTRHRVLRTRSSGGTHNLWDEQMLEHLAAYSPISTRSHRINPVSSYQVQAALAASRRRESINSSIGATSIRRLISLNNRNCRHKVPSHVRRKVCKNFTFFIIAHCLMCAILVPLLGLQGSNSIWHHREQWLHVGPNIGSLLISGMCLLTAGMTLIITKLIRKFGYTLLIGANAIAVAIFLLCHLYPSIYTLLPAYLLLGITLSPSWISKISLVVHLGSKLSCSQHECTLTTSHGLDSMDEHMLFCSRDQRIRRMARWFHVAQDLGIIIGAVVASFALACTSTDWNCYEWKETVMTSGESTTIENHTIETTTQAEQLLATPVVSQPLKAVSLYNVANFWPHISGYFDEFYNLNEHGKRICGADMCPVWYLGIQNHRMDTTSRTNMIADDLNDESNETIYTQFINGQTGAGGLYLIAIYFVFSLISLALTLLMGKIQGTFRHERIKGLTDTLLFAGPLAYFIGTEQAYMLSDFLRAFVSCSLGISMVAGALIGMGIMQAIVSCTLSMLLRHVKRIVVIVAAFFFHSCLLLALSSWKPIQDDTALFYVLAASWGACNGMWETLLLTLITLNHTNHVAEVAAPLQGLRFLALGITFAAHGFMCETPKIILLVIILVISVPPYAMLEIRLETQRKAHLVNL